MDASISAADLSSQLEKQPAARGQRMFADDHEMLEHGMLVYDALYAWCMDGKDELHTWNPGAYK